MKRKRRYDWHIPERPVKVRKSGSKNVNTDPSQQKIEADKKVSPAKFIVKIYMVLQQDKMVYNISTSITRLGHQIGIAEPDERGRDALPYFWVCKDVRPLWVGF